MSKSEREEEKVKLILGNAFWSKLVILWNSTCSFQIRKMSHRRTCFEPSASRESNSLAIFDHRFSCGYNLRRMFPGACDFDWNYPFGDVFLSRRGPSFFPVGDVIFSNRSSPLLPTTWLVFSSSEVKLSLLAGLDVFRGEALAVCRRSFGKCFSESSLIRGNVFIDCAN